MLLAQIHQTSAIFEQQEYQQGLCLLRSNMKHILRRRKRYFAEVSSQIKVAGLRESYWSVREILFPHSWCRNSPRHTQQDFQVVIFLDCCCTAKHFSNVKKAFSVKQQRTAIHRNCRMDTSRRILLTTEIVQD